MAAAVAGSGPGTESGPVPAQPDVEAAQGQRSLLASVGRVTYCQPVINDPAGKHTKTQKIFPEQR